MCKFKQIQPYDSFLYTNISYLIRSAILYQKYFKYLSDDYTDKLTYENLLNSINKLNGGFWLILDNNDNFAGFVILDNWVGDNHKCHSAEITVCIEPRYWGEFTKKAGEKFIKYCFEHYGLKKLKAVVFPDNKRVLELLKSCGFKKEASLIGETMRGGFLQDVDIYSIIKE